MLKADKDVAVEVRHVIERRLRIDLEHEPPHVGVEEALADVVRVVFVIDELVMAAMLRAPHERGILERAGAKNEGEKPDRPISLEGEMREEPVIAERDAKPGKREHHAEQGDLEPVEAVVPDVKGGRGDGQEQRPDEEAARDPVDAFERDSELHRQG